jgi:hypothetical protein
MKGVRYDDDIKMAGALTYLTGEFWTKTLHDTWGLPCRRSTAEWFNALMRDRQLEPLRDGSSFAGTPEVVDLLIGLLGTTRTRAG